MDDSKLLRHGLTAAHAIVNNEPFEMELLEGIRRTVGADCVSIDMWLDWQHRPPTMTLAGEPNVLPSDEYDGWLYGFGDHPYFVNLLSTGDPRPYRTSDFVPFHRLRDNPVYRDLLAKYGHRYGLYMAPRLTEKDRVFIGLARSVRDFSDCETRAFHPLHDIITAALDYQRRVQAIQAKINTNAIDTRPRHLSLTERETQVLRLIAAGYTNDQAARRLGISPRTIRKHLEGVFAKANVPSRAAAVAWWLRRTPP